ncbi:MAG: iron-containing redox enzyme family protein [Bdellovibrionales bacterium]|nr:iron-containing redox enzyme family protein [Bdellovibrionales bacterium]
MIADVVNYRDNRGTGRIMFNKIFQEWQNEIDMVMNQDPWIKKLRGGELDLCHYKGFLLETYHHAGLNPQIQGYCTLYLKGNPRKIIDLFFRHASSEIGHDLLALNDLKVLGEDVEKLAGRRPLPSTIAFNAFVLHCIKHVNPLSYLGYLFHLEFLPTQNGPDYIKILKSMGVPENALTFLEEHATVDIGHNKMMEKYLKDLIQSEKDLDDIIFAAKSSCRLHTYMIADSMKNGEDLFS